VLTKRPLLATAADQRRYVPASPRGDARDEALKHRNTLVVGTAGSGKTSLLAHIAFAARESAQPCLVVSAQLVDHSRDLVDLLCVQAEDEEWIEKAELPSRHDPLGPARQIRRLRDAPEGALVLIDDPTTEQARTLFGQLRDELWQTPLSFVVATSPAVAQALRQPPADAFFNVELELRPFDFDDAVKLLSHLRAAGAELAIDQPPSYPLQPRALVAIAEGDEVQVRLDPDLEHELSERASAAAGPTAAMLLAEIWNRGAVSASDAELQRSFGVSRSRLTELLRALAEADVLESYPDPGEGRTGRPRTLYQVKAQR
jgi:hypothetical protein